MHLNLQTRTLENWLEYIGKLHPIEMDFGLERVKAVAQRLRCGLFAIPVVTVTGTNGKGSCVRFLEEIWGAAGYRVGAFTSPHVMCFNERVRIDHQMVTDIDLIEAFEQVELARREISLSFFEFTFLAALQIFQRAALDVLILEVGLGGRLDAVNMIDADVAVVTTIDLDHMEWLGPDRASIAREKAGIFRPFKPVVCGDSNPPSTLHEIAAKLQAPVHTLGKEFNFEMGHDGVWDWKGKTYWQNLPALHLKHQNAATSLMVVEKLQHQLPVADYAVRLGLTNAKLMGRFEMVSLQSVNCYLDVAHNPEGGRWLAEQWRIRFPQTKAIAVFSMLGDKDIAGTAKYLLDYVSTWYIANLGVSREAKLVQLTESLALLGMNNYRSFTNVAAALEEAIAVAGKTHEAILVFGSFYTVAQARRFLHDKRWL